MTETAEKVEDDDKILFPGLWPGTPENAYVSPLCKAGHHEIQKRNRCRGATRNTPAAKVNYCRCACHTAKRGLLPGTDFPYEPDAQPDPLAKTLADELREWANKHSDALPVQSPKRIVRADDFHDETNRRAKGALEQQVLEVCTDYANLGTDGLEFLKSDLAPVAEAELDPNEDYTGFTFLTTEIISREIGLRYGQGDPSEGAIRNILIKWQDIGFAFIRTKPLAFLLFTQIGQELGLARMKERAR